MESITVRPASQRVSTRRQQPRARGRTVPWDATCAAPRGSACPDLDDGIRERPTGTGCCAEGSDADDYMTSGTGGGAAAVSSSSNQGSSATAGGGIEQRCCRAWDSLSR